MTSVRQPAKLGKMMSGPSGETEEAARPRGRPRSVEADEAIFAAAWAILSEGRYDRLTFEAVADRAGCSRPTVYRRFRNKVELVRALIDPFREAVTPTVPEDADPRTTLLEYLRSWVDYLGNGGGEVIMALWQARREDAEMSAMLDGIYAQGRLPHIDMLRRLAAPQTSDEPFVILVDALLGAILFRCVHCFGTVSALELERLVDQVIAAAKSLP